MIFENLTDKSSAYRVILKLKFSFFVSFYVVFFAFQETMAAVLNHLKKVASNADKNKMNIVNLAICFGPVLLCPSPVSSGGTSLDFKKHIEVLKYLLEIWPVNYGKLIM